MTILPIFIPHAGCPHQCIFCNQKKISGQKLATVENAKVQIAKWQTWLKPSKDNEAAFYGGSFTGLDLGLQEELLALTDELIAQGVIGSVRCSTRPDYIDQERLDLLKKHHVTLVELGVQSMDDAVLEAAERGHTAQDVVKAMELLKTNGFQTGIQLMVGMPKQTEGSIRETTDKVVALKPDIVRLYPLLVIKDTPLEKQYLQGDFKPLELDKAVDLCAYMYDIFTDEGIKVIRIGLQPDDELCQHGNIVAGPFHPSMGELVKSRLIRNQLTPQIDYLHSQGCTNMKIICPPNLQSQVIGMKKANFTYWTRLYPNLKLELEPLDINDIFIVPNEN